MMYLVIGYFSGVVTMLAFSIVIYRYSKKQRIIFESKIANYGKRMHQLEIDKAFVDGRSMETNIARFEAKELREQIAELKNENEKLKEAINTNTIFANKIASGERAVLALRKTQNT